ncbi:MAG: CvpA family protein [Chitinophagaceae bacterium]|nr:CvpA family protein [Chitinophagaceae bacterium]HQV85951.1 CvpA family protein [Chitinophagaceae bacterium]HQZ74383.1 CvpA family protein [Chitinophagaceae bacterium]
MIIDLILGVIILIAIFKGYQRGLIIGLFSLVSVIIGLAAAMKLSTVVAGYIGEAVNVSDEWLPVISFAIVFIVVVLLIRLGANAIERTVEVVMLGWLNKLGGIIFYVAIYTVVFSVLLFYAEQVNLVRSETIEKSISYSFVQPWGPRVINSVGSIVPLFRDMFAELELFFENVSKEIPVR